MNSKLAVIIMLAYIRISQSSDEDTRDLKPVVNKVIGLFQSVSGGGGPKPSAISSATYQIAPGPGSWEGSTTLISQPDLSESLLTTPAILVPVTKDPAQSTATLPTSFCSSCFCDVQEYCNI
ncbi:Hypothetical protein CINCED_3A024425 [Cinara cedri]|uniref:Uncharacterized protein n=1 Tax=Cinara cedri TaxID=506608 RepID=A0A5E4NER3_9HEMI|nr:Hypothetical protein CINCED_3A024425 [Cinara cedri]